MRFSLPSIKCSAAPPQLSTTADRPIIKSLCTCSSDNETVLGSSRGKLGGPAEHLIDGSEKRIRRSTFEF